MDENKEVISTDPKREKVRIASIFILYAFALSEGKMCSLCKLESTINMIASSLLKSRTITGRVSIPSFEHAFTCVCLNYYISC